MTAPGRHDDEPVRVRHTGAVATIEFGTAGTRNGWTPEIDAAYSEAISTVDRDPAVRVVVLRGAGDHFCAGRAVGGLSRIAGEGGDERLAERLSTGIDDTWSCRKPVIAAIRGSCAGIGLCLALLCDVRFAADSARFSTAFVRRGLPAGHGIAWLLTRAIGTGPATELLLSGRKFDAADAAGLGLVAATVGDAALDSHAADYADQLARKCSPRSMAVIKRQLRLDVSRDYPQALRHSLDEAGLAFADEDFREGVASYLNKRDPAFAPLGTGLPADGAFADGLRP